MSDKRRKNSIKIHEDTQKGEIYLNDVLKIQVNSFEAIMDALKKGALTRTTAATNMNGHSSRSHAIFSILIKQQRMVPVEVRNFN